MVVNVALAGVSRSATPAVKNLPEDVRASLKDTGSLKNVRY
jgi:hypothetical protein